MPPRDVTASTIMNMPAPWAMGAISSRGWSTPVEVSAWTIPRNFASGLALTAFSTSPGSRGLPIGALTSTTSAPHRPATSCIREPKTPWEQIMALSPLSIMFTQAVSMPALPVPGMATVRSLPVWKTILRRSLVSSMMATKSLSRWPRSAMA